MGVYAKNQHLTSNTGVPTHHASSKPQSTDSNNWSSWEGRTLLSTPHPNPTILSLGRVPPLPRKIALTSLHLRALRGSLSHPKLSLFICSRTQTSARCTRNVSPSCRKTYSSLDGSGAHYDDSEKVEQVVKIVATTGKGFCGRLMATLVLTDFSGGVQGVFASGWLGCRAVGSKASFCSCCEERAFGPMANERGKCRALCKSRNCNSTSASS